VDITSLTVVGISLAVVLGPFAYRAWARGGIVPPHEFAYGATLGSAEEIATRLDEFLSLDALDPEATQIQTCVGNQSQKTLKPLISYLSSQREKEFDSLIARLKEVEKSASQREKAIQLVRALLPYKDLLRDESRQDTIIVFVGYGVKDQSKLSGMSAAAMGNLVKQLDTPKQSDKFASGKSPRNYLLGNVNIYPLNLENTSWHGTTDLESGENAPILEIRFMGLRGIFRYLLDEMTQKTGASFAHLDGESLDAP
jgi:hypothetical protein